MATADKALHEALDRIAGAREGGGIELDLSLLPLPIIPEEIEALAGLQTLDLTGTPVTDLTPLQGLTGLQTLILDGTQVTDLTPLQGLAGLQSLYLAGTSVTDLTPLQGLFRLQTLRLAGTQVTDLTPLQGLTGLQYLRLADTKVTDLTPLQGLTGLQSLALGITQVTDLAPLQGLSGLQRLDLTGAPVSDLTPLQGLTGLDALGLRGTPVTDLTPLQGLTGLWVLTLNGTPVSDLTPLQGLTGLQSLDLDGAKVLDLRPIRDLPFEFMLSNAVGLRFTNTPAARATPELTRLSQIEDDADRTRETLAYLRTLPPYPQPAPWDEGGPPATSTDDPGAAEPDIPANQPAPLQVTEIDGVLRPAAPGDDLDNAGHRLAQQGWDALRDYLDDLADQRQRIDNSMPRLGKALTRLDAALGEIYDDVNPVAVGTQGNRVIRLSAQAPELLMEEDAADVQEFAAALALFLERFPDWRAYRDAAITDAEDPAKVQQALPQIEELAESMEDRPEIDPGIPDSLEEQAESVREDPSDPIAATGVIASTGNVLSALASKALPVLRWVKNKVGDIAGMTWTEVKKAIAKEIAGAMVTVARGTGLAALDIIFNKAAILKSLAAKFPDKLGWLLKLLNAFGL